MMKSLTIRPRAALLIGAAFVATPAFAQDAPATQTVTPPPIMVPAPAPQAQAPAPRVIRILPQAPVVQAVPETPAAAPAEPRATQTRSTATRTTSQTRAASQPRAAAPAPAAASAPAPAAAPVTESPAPTAALPETVTPPVVEAQPAPAPAAEATTTQTTSSGFSLPWLLGGLALIIAGIAAALLMRRRREPEYVEESTYRETVVAEPVAEPVAVPVAAPAKPVIEPRAEFAGLPAAIPIAEPEVREAQAAVATAEDVSVSEPGADDLAGVVDGTAPVARRPWIELGMRPVRAGTDKDDAIVDFELTVGNSGDTLAKDVRISTFMLADGGTESEIESMLIDNRDDSAVTPVSIEPGEGTRVDAHLAVPKGELGRSFNPVVVAEARYTLPDGRQGRTSAAFRVGVASETGVRPLSASRPFVTETVEAELFGVPEHA